ncbi:MAG: hypothetical protein J6V84_05485 [Clostridia bacterium]|nr:hypothetical protein [Clostridia bacterium]
MYGIVDRKNHEYYTYMSKVFQAMNNAHLKYNWLITDCVCYPQNKYIEKMLDQKYCWISGDELSAIIEQEDFQWIWGCLCGFSKDIKIEDILKYPLPSSEGYNGYYQNPVSFQHPLSCIEIVPHDSAWTLIISKDKMIIDDYKKSYPKTEDLEVFNQE